MKFVLPQSLFRGACSQKVSKNLKIKWDQVTLPKTGLFLVGTNGPLGIKGEPFKTNSKDKFEIKIRKYTTLHVLVHLIFLIT
jgi:hypothetical protein